MPASPPPRSHLQPTILAVVLVGGALGTAAREGVVVAVPRIGGLPLAILLINVVGAFVLGVLLEALARGGPDQGGRRLIRLAVGTGFCGGFTTYSTLAVGTAELLRSGTTGLAVAYAVGSVLLGALAAWVGVLVGSRR